MIEIINKINDVISKKHFFELSFYQFEKDSLTIVGSEDLLYYHEIEIKFINVFSINCNSNFKVDTNKNILLLISNSTEAFEINKKYFVTQGNFIFKIFSEDDQDFFIIAESIEFIEKIVKYEE